MPVPEKLLQIRERKDLSLRPTNFLKKTFTGFDGEEHPLKIRYYQVQGILHLVAMKSFLLGDDCGLGKTLQSIAALCYIWESKPDTKVIVMTTKSAIVQWANEFDKFTTGVTVIPYMGTPQKRAKVRKVFETTDGPTVLVGGYRSFVRDISDIQHYEDFVFLADECTAFKNPKTQVHQVCKHLASQASRSWGLSATMIKNHLMEVYGIFRVLKPDLFPISQNKFMMYYCIVRMQRIPKSNRLIPVIVSYPPERVRELKELISPFYLGRAKYEVASDLPVLVTKTVQVGLSEHQQDKYEEALSGLLEMGRGEDQVVKETDKLTQIIYCQEIVDHPDLIGCDGRSGKLDALIDMLKEGDLEDEKVIVFTRFSKMVDILMGALAKAKIPAVRVTGKEKQAQRVEAMSAFQDPKNPTRVVCITMAGGDAINLQAAKALVFYDTPWSAGDVIQIIGRMIRIGSLHDRCYTIHLVSRGRTPSIDNRVLEVMHRKMKLIETVLGQRVKGENTPDTEVSSANDISDLFSLLVEDARQR